MTKYTFPIFFALFIDFLQAGLSLGLTGVGLASGVAAGVAGKLITTATGAIIGCAGGAAIGFVAGGVGAIPGCLIGGGSGAAAGAAAGVAVGTLLGAAAAQAGILFGIVISLCISFTFGSMLIMYITYLCGWNVVLKNLGFSGADFIPGLNNLPAWTLFTIRVSMAHAKEEGGPVFGSFMAPLTMLSVRGIMSTKEQTMRIVQRAKVTRPEEQERAITPQDTEQLATMARTRVPMHDIKRPSKPNVQTT